MFRKKPTAPTLPPEWLIVGLGNPGPEYRGTRHNVGFDFIDRLAERHRIKLDRSKHQARYGTGTLFDTSVALAKPLTFMNLSGRAIAPLMRDFGLTPQRVLVVADDTDLPPGRVRLRAEGSAGGHGGHKSLIASLGTQEYPRLKIGIGRTPKDATIGHVLGPFHPDERVDIDAALKRCEEALETLFSRGVEAAMAVANGA
ncbi:aminoacyl-tRNA hydrolase [bacterium]|nr:MAG: aminoacyl-tRNA hydrolase [bacterium]